MKKNEAAYWQKQLELACSNPLYRKWRKTTKSIIKRFRNKRFADERTDKAITNTDENRGYNLLYRNVSVRVPFILPFIPKIQVDRTNRENDGVGRTAAMILERVANKIIDTGEFKTALDAVKMSAELSNLGVIWVSYNPIERANGLIKEDVLFEFVSDADFLWQKSKKWEDVDWVARRLRLTKSDMENQYGITGYASIENNESYDDLEKLDIVDKDDRCEETISVYEIWDRREKQVYIYQPSDNRLLAIYDYPYDIDFPCAKPLSYDTFVDSTVPMSRHAQFLAQYKAVDECNRKIMQLKNDLRVAGAYDASVADFGKIFDASNDNKMLGLKNTEKYRGKALSDMVWMYDPQPAVNALIQLKTTRDAFIEDIQRGVGTYDILEGETDSKEAYGTNRLKGSFGTMRLQDDQKDAIYFVQDTIRIGCDIMCQVFDPLSILSYSTIEYSNQSLPMVLEAIGLLKDSGMKDVRLTISLEDVRSYYDAEYKANITEMWSSVFTQLTASVNMVQQIPEMAGVCKEAIMSMIRGYKVGAFVEQSMEQAIDNTIQSFLARMEQPQQPTPEMLKIQNEQQKIGLEREKLQIEAEKTGAELERQAMDDQTRAMLENKRIEAETAKIISDRKINEEELRLKEKELDAEIKLAIYSALHPDIKVDTNIEA